MSAAPESCVHAEAYCLMWYVCRGSDCGHVERIWNSRDGVTPFGTGCPSCGGTLTHQHWHRDTYAPDHKLHRGQRFWRDGTPDEAAEIMRKRLSNHPGGRSAEWDAQLIEDARLGRDHDFTMGWPVLDVHMGDQ